MAVIRALHAPSFQLPGLAVTGLASPSRGARETSVWRITLSPGAPGAEHSVDREEIFLVLKGRAQATLAGEELLLDAGDLFIVPAGQLFSLRNPHDEPCE